MKFKKILTTVVLLAVLSTVNPCALLAQSQESLLIYTPYTKVSVAPGKSISYSIDLINNGNTVRNEDIEVSNIPRSWKHTLTAGGYNINKMEVLPDDQKTMTLKIDVPYQVRKGAYTFYAKAGKHVSLPLTVNVSSAGSSESELTCDQKNMEGTSKSNFSFRAVLKNQTPTNQQYALMAKAPRGWSVAIKPNSKSATSTEVVANGTKNITYDIKTPATIKAGTYKIPVKAIAGSTSAETEFEVVITGTYEMKFSTPSGLLSSHMTAGDEQKIELVVENTGSTALEDIGLKSSKPRSWEVTFDPGKIEKLLPGKKETVYATVKADKKAIPGDYAVKFDAKTPEVNQSLSFRVAVKTPMLMGWLGIFIIVVAIGGVFYLFKKFGRR